MKKTSLGCSRDNKNRERRHCCLGIVSNKALESQTYIKEGITRILPPQMRSIFRRPLNMVAQSLRIKDISEEETIIDLF